MSDSKALEEYKRFIDGVVAETPSVLARRVRIGKWMEVPTPSQQKYQDLLGRLRQEDRELLAEIVQEAAESAIHGVLRFLTDEEYRIRRGPTELAWEPFGTEMYYDYVARLNGDEWPEV